MKFNLEYHQGIIEVKAFGDAEVQVFEEILEAVINHENWKPGGRFLVDHSKLNVGLLTINDIREVAQFCEQRRDKFGNAKFASVLDGDLQYGLARMWQVFIENKWDVTENLFKSRDEAINWLLSIEHSSK